VSRSRRVFAEEGITAAAYVVVSIVGGTWTIDEVTIVSAKPSTDVLMVRSLGSMAVQPRLSGDDVLYWRSDIF